MGARQRDSQRPHNRRRADPDQHRTNRPVLREPAPLPRRRGAAERAGQTSTLLVHHSASEVAYGRLRRGFDQEETGVGAPAADAPQRALSENHERQNNLSPAALLTAGVPAGRRSRRRGGLRGAALLAGHGFAALALA